MNFDQILKNILLLEDLQDNLISMIKLKDPNISDDNLNNLLSKINNLDQKKGNDSKRLLEFYYQLNKNFDVLQEEYQTYLVLLKKGLLKKDINAFKSFTEFADYIHSIQGSLNKKTNHKIDFNLENHHFNQNYGDIPLVYQTNELKIYQVRNVKDAIILGHGLPYTGQPFCISRTSNNLYNTYRRVNGTFYFIFYKHPKESLKNGYVMVFNNKGDNQYELTFINNSTENWNLNNILSTFPELKEPINKNILKNIPQTDEEKSKMELYEECQQNDEQFYKLNEQQLNEYIEYSYNLNLNKLKFLKSNNYNQLINNYCTKGIKLNNQMFDLLSEKERNVWRKNRYKELMILYNHDKNIFFSEINNVDINNIKEIFSIIEKISDENTQQIIEKYTPLIKNGILDGNVDISNQYLVKIPDIFKNIKITGNFNCSNNQLTSLEGSPNKVGGDFYCSYNQLTSLEGCPNKVGGYFSCYNNQLTSLEGSPKEVGGYFSCSNNQLTSLEGCPKEVGGYFSCYNNQLTSLEGCPNKVGGYFSCSNNPVKFSSEDKKKAMENRRKKEESKVIVKEKFGIDFDKLLEEALI